MTESQPRLGGVLTSGPYFLRKYSGVQACGARPEAFNFGSAPGEIELVTDNLIQANLTGHDSHGIGMIPRYIDAVLEGGLAPNQHPKATLDAGALLALDDTGAGFAGLRHLLHLHPDIIKLDISLVTGIDADPARRAHARSLCAEMHAVGRKPLPLIPGQGPRARLAFVAVE